MVGSSNPSSVCFVRCAIGQDTSRTLPAGCGQRAHHLGKYCQKTPHQMLASNKSSLNWIFSNFKV